MACDLTRSRGKECKDVMGGNSMIYLYDELKDAFTLTAETATGMNVALTAAYSYELEGDGSSLEQIMVSDINTGTRTNTQTITFVLKKQSAADLAEFNLLCASGAQAVIKDRAGNYHALGLTEGMTWNVTSTTGAAKTDLQGFTITGTAIETKYAPLLDSATTAAFLAVVVAVV